MKNYESLFLDLYKAGTEDEVDKVIERNKGIFADGNWKPLGGDEKMFGIVRGQQASPIAALVEKITNSMDAILIKKCRENGIDPQSPDAPRTMEEAIDRFFPESKNWDLDKFRRQQAEEIQILADGRPRDTSVIIYDNGEGQHPKDFEGTFLSLVRGNKINIHFVQGKYNMGGSGALVFCGKKRYQLLGSKKFDNTGNFGFTLLRYRKVEAGNEERRFGNFEYLTIGGEIPSFPITELDLNLLNRKFKTGSIIKLYSYQFPSGYSGFAQDLNQSLNEYLFQPVLPLYTVEKKERYPNNKILHLDLFGLKRRLEKSENNYVQRTFAEEYVDNLFGEAKVTCYIFKPKLEGYTAKESKKVIRDRFFKNDMAVIFSVNGQVHGHFTTEFISRTLKFNMLKDHLLIHVDCTKMHTNFKEELFMSSRDRLKDGDETKALRAFIGKKLQKSELSDIDRQRKEAIGFESEDLTDLIKNFARNIPKNSDLFKLLENTLRLDEKNKEQPRIIDKKPQKKEDKEPFKPQRFPTFMHLHHKKEGGVPVITIPLGGEKTIKFDSDVADDYFDRSDEPGAFRLAILTVQTNDTTGGTAPGEPKAIGEIFGVSKSSPNEGQIKITLTPNKDLQVGDEIEVKASLTGPGEVLEQIVKVKIAAPEEKKEEAPKEEDDSIDQMGLPTCEKVDESKWDVLESQGISMGRSNVMFPAAEGDTLKTIYVNIDCDVFLNHRKKLNSSEQIELAQRKFVASVYFHTIFLYMVTKKRGYTMQLPDASGNPSDVDVTDYVKEVFDSFYSEFLLNFGMEELINAI